MKLRKINQQIEWHVYGHKNVGIARDFNTLLKLVLHKEESRMNRKFDRRIREALAVSKV